jgi:hypothetical protein
MQRSSATAGGGKRWLAARPPLWYDARMVGRLRQSLARLLLALIALAVVGAPVGALAAPCAMQVDPCVACPMQADPAPAGADQDGKAAPVLKACGCIAMLKAVAATAPMSVPAADAPEPDAPILALRAGLPPETDPRPPRSL